jgi:outer membrane protein OmpA-like peptidoglycan-associated protein
VIISALILAWVLARRATEVPPACAPSVVELVEVKIRQSHEEVLADFHRQFDDDLPRWGAVIDDERLAISFPAASMLFDVNSARIKPKLRQTLRQFFPRFVALARRHADVIDSIQVEGYTDTTGRYLYNMKLSQDRSRNALKACFAAASAADVPWLQDNFFAAGASYARPADSRARSRRIEFMIKLNRNKIMHNAPPNHRGPE